MARLKNPLISTIIPIYKVEEYLRQTLDSVIAQDIGFSQNIELILLNDGSPDRSDVICREYQAKYPDNIIYIEQENAGVSAARNAAMSHANGKYIHFFDSDDLMQENAYSEAINFLSRHEDKIDFVAFRLEFFDARLGGHPLNYKFTGNRVIDVSKEPDAPILHMPTCIILRSAITHKFDTDIKISEDMKFLTELLSRKKQYGVISSSTYFYRKRRSGTSAIDGSRSDRTFYTVTPKRVYEELFQGWSDDTGIHRYAQHVVMYDIQWRLMQKKQDVLSGNEERAYKKTIQSLIKQIDDEVILAQRYAELSYIRYALEVKHGKRIPQGTLSVLEKRAKTKPPVVIINFINRIGRNLELEGYVGDNPLQKKITVTLSGEKLPMQNIKNPHAEQQFLGELVDARGSFKLKIPADKYGDVIFRIEGGDAPLRLVFRRFSRLAVPRFSYATFGGAILVNIGGGLGVRQYSIRRHVGFELRWLSRIALALKLKESAQRLRAILLSHAKGTVSLKELAHPFILPLVTGFRNLGTIFYRVAYVATKPLFRNKEVWIVSDRTTAAGDNGEALHAYIQAQSNPNIRLYFAVSKTSSDYSRMKRQGRVLDSDGIWYKIAFLHASKIISSHADDHVINPFAYRLRHLNDLYKFDYVFLQHGIIRNDLSAWLNRYNKNIKLFVTSARAEYDSILGYQYCYTDKEVILSGLPRYDLLENAPRKKLILAPTWRHALAPPLGKPGGRRLYNPDFKKSDYFGFYNNLMNDKRLHEALSKSGMTGELYLHPAFEGQIKDFQENDTFTVKDFPYDYRAAFKEGSVLVTDYSSVFFDFAYLKKPVVYCQYDIEEYYQTQTIYTRGYMDDKKDGFGPVAETYDDTVAAIVSVIESGCKMESKYEKRVDNFFEWHDRNNSKRVYDAILKIDEKE